MKKRSECPEMRDELTAFFYGELAADEHEAVERHVAACASCSLVLAELRETAALLAQWNAPPADDAAALVAEVRARASRPRIPRTALRIAAAAAALLFVFLTVLGSEVHYSDGELTLSLRLTEADGGAAVATTPDGLESTVRRIAAEEVEDWTLYQQEERLRLVAAFDRLRAADQRVLAGLLDSFRTRNARENTLTRKALVDLASYVTRPQ